MSLQKDLYVEEARYVPRTRRAFVRASQRMQSRVSLMRLAEALQAKDMTKAMKAVGADEFEMVLKPFDAIIQDVFMKGGKVGGRSLS
jgi:hypothetical protein